MKQSTKTLAPQIVSITKHEHGAKQEACQHAAIFK